MKITVDLDFLQDVEDALDFLEVRRREMSEASKKEETRDIYPNPKAAPGEVYGKDFRGSETPTGLETPDLTEDTDIEGTLWDAELHSSGKTQLANGKWRPKAKRGKGKGTPDTSQPPNFSDLLALSAKVIDEKKATVAEVVQVCIYLGVPNLPSLKDSPELIAQAFDLITQRHNTPIGG